MEKCMHTKVVRVGCSIIEATTITGVPFQMPILKVYSMSALSFPTLRGQLATLVYTIHDNSQLPLLV